MRIYFTSSYNSAINNNLELSSVMASLARDNKITRRPFKIIENDPQIDLAKKILDIREQSISDTYKEMLKRIRESDVIIVDASYPSNSIGYEIAMAQTERKPILIVFNLKISKQIHNVFSGNESSLLTIKGYSSIENLTDIATDFIDKSKKQIDTKFILIISPEIDSYLEWCASERRMHKAQIVRGAVEDLMGKDKEYKDFQKSMSS